MGGVDIPPEGCSIHITRSTQSEPQISSNRSNSNYQEHIMPVAQTYKFNFKSRRITDENGNEIGRTKKQPSLTIDLPVPSTDEVIAMLQAGGAEAVLLFTQIGDTIYQAARSQFDEIIEQFGDDDSKEVTADMLNYDQLSISYLANLPPSSRGVQAISDEEWQAFFEDYLAVMVAATGKTEDRIKNHINLFKKPQKAKANKEVLKVLVDQLDIYLASSGNLEDTGTCAVRTRDRFNKWISEPEKAANLDLL